MVRPRRMRRIAQMAAVTFYKPQGIPLTQLEEIVLSHEGLEAIRLADSIGLDQDTASQQMAVSKSTFCRILAEARMIVAKALTQGYALRIDGGNYVFDETQPDTGQERCCPRKRCCEQE